MSVLNNNNIIQCMCCGNRDSSLIIRRDGGYVCKCCGVWYKSEATQEEIISQVRCENGYAQLRTYRFNDARDTFENVLLEDPNNITALWGVLLARFGVVFIKGFYKNVVEPIYCFQNYDRMKNRYVQSEPEYIKLMELLQDDNELRFDYERKAKKIDDAIDDFKRYKESTDRDVFICVKISAATSANPELKGTTEDYEFAMRLYEDLEKRGVNTFFSYVTLKNEVDSDEKIWRNLVKSKKMLLVASKEEYLESPWVKSEWKRWLFLKRANNLYIYVLTKPDESPYDILPNEFANNQIYTHESYKKLLKDICEGLDVSSAAALRKKREAEEREKREAEERKKREADNKKTQSASTAKNKKPKGNKKAGALVGAIACVAACGVIGFMALGNVSQPNAPGSQPTVETTNATTVPIIEFSDELSGLRYKIISDAECEIIGIGMFSGKTLSIPEKINDYNVVKIGGRAFYNCTTLASVIIPDSVTDIGYSAFQGCSGFTSVTIPGSVTDIGYSAFQVCSRLTSVTIQEGVTSIGKNAFLGCTCLESITIPGSVTIINEMAFYGCSGLKDINYSGTVSEWVSIKKGNSWNYNIGNYTIYCTNGTIAKDGTVKYN